MSHPRAERRHHLRRWRACAHLGQTPGTGRCWPAVPPRASWGCAIRLWNLKSGALHWAGQLASSVQCLAFAPDGRTLASGGDDASVQLWDATSGTKLRTLTRHSGPVFALAWRPDGGLLASGSFDGQIRLWEQPWAQSETLVQVLNAHTDWVLGLAFAPNERTLA